MACCLLAAHSAPPHASAASQHRTFLRVPMIFAATGQKVTTPCMECASTSPRELFALRGSCEHRGVVPLRGLRGGYIPYPGEIKKAAAQFKPQPGAKFSRDELTRAQFYDNRGERVAPQLWLSLFRLMDWAGPFFFDSRLTDVFKTPRVVT